MVTARTGEMMTDAAGLVMADEHGQLQFMAASRESVKNLELFQIRPPRARARTASGSAPGSSTPTWRWPPRAGPVRPRARGGRVPVVHAFPLRHTSIVIGALNLFSSTVGRFDAQDVKIIQSLADVATIGVLQQRAVAQGEILTEQLQTALESRVTIEQAKGALARIRTVSVDEAFTLMRDHARRNHLPSPNSPAASSPTRPATPN